MGFNRDKPSKMKRKGPGKGALPRGPKKLRQKGPKEPREPDGEPMIEEQDGEVAMAEGQPEAGLSDPQQLRSSTVSSIVLGD